jgi:hypothetical protein
MLVENRLLSQLIIITLCLTVSCSDDVPEPVNCEESGLSLSLGSTSGASGCSVADGSITVIATGGKEPYSFSINNLSSQSEGKFSGLLAGIYSVKVVDANKCEAAISNVTLAASGFSVNAQVQPDNLCLEGGGSITITVEDGQAPPYQYQLQGNSFSDNNIFTGLQEGSHQIAVKDNNNCTVQLNVTVPHGNTATSWTTQIQPIIELRCATSGCHDGKFRPDLREYEKAFFYRDLIKKYTRDKSMPFDGPALTQDQISLISCWVDDGAPQN